MKSKKGKDMITMNISAVFIVEKKCIEKLYGKDESTRMDYLLGIGDDKSFEKYIKDMEDFVYTPSCFYTSLVKDIMHADDVLNNDLECVLKFGEYQLYIVQPEDLTSLRERNYDKSKIRKVLQLLNKETKGKSEQFHIMMKENIETFINLFSGKYPNHYYGLLVFKMD